MSLKKASAQARHQHRRPAPSACSVGMPVGLFRRPARRPTPSACSVDPFPSASSCSLLNGPTREPQAASTESRCFFLYIVSAHSLGTQPFSCLRLQSASMLRPSHTATLLLLSSCHGRSWPRLVSLRTQLLRIALIDRPSHACTDMTHYIQVRCVSQARNAFRCNGQVQTQRHG